MIDFLPFALPDIDENEINAVVECMKSGWLTTGPKTLEFEKSFKDYLHCDHACAVNSATAGLHLALDAIGLKAGDKVVTTCHTFTATAEVIRYFQADPIFCDIDEKTFNIDPKKLEEVLENNKHEKIKAIIPVHMAGQACDMDPILDLAKKYNLKVIEDAAHALPTTYKGKLVGTLSDLTVYSFYATKTLACGEGGMVVTNNSEYAQRIKMMRLHGFNRAAWDRYTSDKPSWHYDIVAPGYKYNMTDIAASIGLEQLKKIEKFYEKRKFIADTYNNEFSNLNFSTPYLSLPDDKHAYHLYIIQIDESKRDKFIELMSEEKIGTSVHFIPLHIQRYWKEKYSLCEQNYPVSTKVFKQSVSLPLYTKMSDSEIDRVISSVKKVMDKLA